MPRTRADRANVTPDEIRTRAALCHLSAVLGFVVPFASVAAPYLAWRRLRDDGPYVDAHGRAAVEVNLAFLGLEALLFGAAGLAVFLDQGPALVLPLMGLVVAVFVAHVGAILYAAVRAHQGRDVDWGFRVPVLAD